MFNWFRKKEEKNDIRNFFINQLQTLKKNNLELKSLYEKSKSYSINKNIKEICKTSDKILEVCINDNSRISKLNLFINYYQVEIIKIVSQYVSIKNNKIESNETKDFISKVDEFIGDVAGAFNNILEELIIDNNKNIDVDIKIMLKSLEDTKLLGEKHDWKS